MKNKKSLYVLLPLALFVWGLIAYKIYMGFYGGADIPLKEKPKLYNEQYLNDSTDSFTISNDYPDPFLKSLKPERKPETKKITINTSIKNKNLIEVQWPLLTYAGTVKSNKTKRVIGMLNIGGENLIVKQGDNIDGFFIKKVTSDSIQIEYKKKIKMGS